MAKLYFRYGAMGCGKTMQLLQVAFNYEERGMKVAVIKPRTDTKNGTKILTRIGPERETDFCFDRNANLYDLVSQKYQDVSCVLVDEAQFLTKKQADELSRIVAKLDIPVMAYGLRLNFRQEDGGFEGATRLLQIADDIEEIKTICECGHKATRNARLIDGKIVTDGPDVLIDGSDQTVEYKAFCFGCYHRRVTDAEGDPRESRAGEDSIRQDPSRKETKCTS